MKSIQTIALIAVLGMVPTVGFAADAVAVPVEVEAKTIEYVAGMTGIT